MTSTEKAKKANKPPPGAWQVEDARWGEQQRVRLTTGPASLIGDAVQIRSIHIAAFVEDNLLLVQNKDETWTFPGGRLEGSETLREALVREVWEEARATLTSGHTPIAATRIEFLNRVPGRVYRVHPTYLLWVTGAVSELSDEPHNDPADGVVGRRVVSADEARKLLAPLEQRVLTAALEAKRIA